MMEVTRVKPTEGLTFSRYGPGYLAFIGRLVSNLGVRMFEGLEGSR